MMFRMLARSCNYRSSISELYYRIDVVHQLHDNKNVKVFTDNIFTGE